MSFDIKGKLIEKFETVQVTDRFRKREFVIEHREIVGGNEYVDTIKFQLTQDRCELLDNISKGEEISVSFNIRGRRWDKDGKVNYFNNLEAWKIERMEQEQQSPPPVPPAHDIDDIPPEPTDDLPF
ncbi:MAG: DUF3127 domain-containing protein [Bacteroidales bacterium]